MESVGLESFAGKFPGYVCKSTRARNIDTKGNQQNHDGGDTRLNMHAAKEQADEGFINDVQRGQEQQPGFDERRKILKLPVAVRMFFVGRLIGNADRQECDDGSDQVEAGVQGF